MITLNVIKSFKKKTNGMRPRTSESNVIIKSGYQSEKSIDYLTSPKVYPYFFDYKKSAIYFIETNDEIKHNEESFFYEKLQSDARYLIKVDVTEFMTYLDTLKLRNDPEIIFIHHPGRCGSTLLHMLMASHRAVEAFSEDLIFENVLTAENPEFSQEVLRSLVLFIASKTMKATHQRLLFKLTGPSFSWFDKLVQMFPSAKHIYLTRDPVKVSESFLNLHRSFFVGRLLLKLKMYNMKLIPYSMTQSPIYPPLYKDPYFAMRKVNKNGKQFKISSAESYALLVLIKDEFFASQASNKNLLNLNYQDILSMESLRNRMNSFLGFDLTSGINEKIYEQHSQGGSNVDLSGFKYRGFTQSEKEGLQRFVVLMSEKHSGTLSDLQASNTLVTS